MKCIFCGKSVIMAFDSSRFFRTYDGNDWSHCTIFVNILNHITILCKTRYIYFETKVGYTDLLYTKYFDFNFLNQGFKI